MTTDDPYGLSDWSQPGHIYERRGDFNLGPFNFGGGSTQESKASQEANAALAAGRAGGFASPDAGAMRAQQDALSAIGSRAFGGPEPGYAQAQEAAHVSPYAAQAGQLRSTRAVGGQALGDALTTTGQAQMAGAANAMQMSNAADRRRQEAQARYGAGAGKMRSDRARMAEFNANQEGGLNSTIYDQEYGGARLAQQREDQQNAGNTQSAEQIALSSLMLLAAL